jgi:Na+(H+)/acetate symporter ActP
VLGAIGRHYAPELLANGNADSVVLVLPQRVFSGIGGELLGALVSAGAFAAFLSTASGLVLSIAGVVSQDLLAKRIGAVSGFRVGTAVAVFIPLALTLHLRQQSLAEMVAMAFAVAASTFCPLLVLGIWWRHLSTAGAVAGLVVGGATSLGAVLVTLFVPTTGLLHTVLVQPAAWTVPLSFATMMVVSRWTPNLIPANAAVTLGRLHTPDKFVD